jgi:hypothetical protein
MKKLLLIPLLALVAACSPLDTAAGVGGLPPPGEVANTVKLDEKAGIAVETMYTATVKAGALAFRSGLISPSANPEVHAPGFCAKVAAGTFIVTDTGSRVNALECKLRAARDLTRASYDALNGESYDAAAREAIRSAKELLSLLGS